jgi:hypothetical protein
MNKMSMFNNDDLATLRELLPPKRGELLRRWMLRSVASKLLTLQEALGIKDLYPDAWDKPLNSGLARFGTKGCE